MGGDEGQLWGTRGRPNGKGKGGIEEVGGKGVSLVKSAGLEIEGGGAILEDDGRARDGVIEVEVGESLEVVGGGGGERGEVGEVGADKAAGDGSVGVGDVGRGVGEVGEVVEDELEGEAEGDGAGGGGAKLAKGFEAAAVLAVEGTGEATGRVAAGDRVAGEGADGSDFGEGGGEAWLGKGAVGGGGLEGLALATKGFGGEAAAVGRG